jgi:hypothetical protein
MLISTAGQDETARHQEWQARRLWSLWGMINYQVFGLVGFLKLLCQELTVMSDKTQALAIVQQHAEAQQGLPSETYVVTAADQERVNSLLAYASTLFIQLNLESAQNRVERFQRRMRGGALTPQVLGTELQVLRDALEDDVRYKYFYRYPDEKAKKLLRFEADWGPALGKDRFPSIKDDASRAVDCYAMGHDTACVFHCMRVLEYGLAALAKAVGRVFDVQQWHNIIDEIESEIKTAQARPKSIQKDEDLRFYSQAAKEFRYFKDGWRNYVSHKRVFYDENEALGTLDHVRVFMIHLSARLSE